MEQEQETNFEEVYGQVREVPEAEMEMDFEVLRAAAEPYMTAYRPTQAALSAPTARVHDRETEDLIAKLRLLVSDVQSTLDHYRNKPSVDKLWQVAFAVDQLSGELQDALPQDDDGEQIPPDEESEGAAE